MVWDNNLDDQLSEFAATCPLCLSRIHEISAGVRSSCTTGVWVSNLALARTLGVAEQDGEYHLLEEGLLLLEEAFPVKLAQFHLFSPSTLSAQTSYRGDNPRAHGSEVTDLAQSWPGQPAPGRRKRFGMPGYEEREKTAKAACSLVDVSTLLLKKIMFVGLSPSVSFIPVSSGSFNEDLLPALLPILLLNPFQYACRAHAASGTGPAMLERVASAACISSNMARRSHRSCSEASVFYYF